MLVIETFMPFLNRAGSGPAIADLRVFTHVDPPGDVPPPAPDPVPVPPPVLGTCPGTVTVVDDPLTVIVTFTVLLIGPGVTVIVGDDPAGPGTP
jgi:hypothetical protein